MDYVKIVSTKLSVEEISDLVAAPSCGAVSMFVGTTRDSFDGNKVDKQPVLKHLTSKLFKASTYYIIC